MICALRKPVPSSLRRLVPLAALLLAATPGPAAVPEEPGYDAARLEIVEDLSESLANDLLALSVDLRDLDMEAAASYFADPLVADPLPRPAARTEPVRSWIARRAWSSPGTETKLSRASFVAQLRTLLEHFSEREDVRLKVLDADFDPEQPDSGSANVKFFIIGRDLEGRREWLRGVIRVQATRGAEGGWRIDSWRSGPMESMLASTDLFSDVTRPAGLAAVFPPFGVGANQGFVSHGVAVADVNADGFLDLATTGVEKNRLYISQGNGRFVDLSDDSLVGFTPSATGPLFLDFDQDGDRDLFLARVGDQVLLENRWIPDGTVKFWDVSERAGVNVPAVGFSAVAGDVNGDGWTDIYVASYNRYGYVMPDSWNRAMNGTPNLLFLNQGDGTFRESARQLGVADTRWSYAAAMVDVNGDGMLDLYVANDFGENAYYRNSEDGFQDVAGEAELVDPGFGMGVSFGDYDNDGDFDLHITNMSSMAGARVLRRLDPEQKPDRAFLDKLAAGNSLYQNQGDGTFQDVSVQVGGFPGGWAFGGGFVDFDNDGWQDLYTPNGFISGKSMKDT
jgi:FG-GAP-like repeat